MRQADLDHLSQPYSGNDERPERRLAQALGVNLPAVAALHDAIAGDLDEHIYGIGWWAPYPGTSRRILISDYLVQCVQSIEKNFIEARLHFLDGVDAWDREQDFLADAVQRSERGRPRLNLPRRQRATDDLPHAMANLHAAGLFRAVNAALDCLGTAIVGVLALPVRILFADLDHAQAALEGAREEASDGEALQVRFRERFRTLVEGAGPPEWLRWTIRFRNTLVHRARRLQFTQLRSTSTLYGADGAPIVRLEAVPHLPRDPELSDVEAMLSRASGALVLEEHAETTLGGILGSAVKLVEGGAAELLTCWAIRRASPDLLRQPPEQWPNGAAPPSTQFPGYAARSFPVNPGMLIAGPDAETRLKAAALSDDRRGQWNSFD